MYQRESDDRWVVQFRDVHGRSRYRYRDPRGRKIESRTHARQALRAYLQQRGEGAGGDGPRLSEWTDWWLEQLDVRPTTAADYRYKIGLLPDWLTRRRLAQITPMDVQEALADLASSSTVPVDEARRLLEYVEDRRLGSLFTVALSLGLRQGECGGLQWADVDLDAGTISVVHQITRTNEHIESEGAPKTRRSRRSLILPRVCIYQLRRHQRQQSVERSKAAAWTAREWVDRDVVWPSARGTPLSPSNLRRLPRRRCELADYVRSPSTPCATPRRPCHLPKACRRP